jgi:quinolinate synthase
MSSTAEAEAGRVAAAQAGRVAAAAADREDKTDRAGGADWADWAAQIRRLARQRDAVILAHNYQVPEIQDVADHVGDSLALSRLAAASTARTIVFAGVYFMAETAKILAPDRTVLIPDSRAGCSLADSITAPQVREWKAEHPGAAVVAYVNTSAEVKAESDVCCTSANAVPIVRSLPADQEILFLPDQFLGAHVQRATGRANMHVWLGGMLEAARTTKAPAVLVATETGMLHQLRRANPAVRWEPVNPNAVCRYMKMITPATLLRCLRDGVEEVHVAPDVADRARRAVQAMIAVGTPSAAGE